MSENPRHTGLADPQIIGDVLLAFSSGVANADGAFVDGLPAVTSRACTAGESASLTGFSHVVGVGSQMQMRRVDAPRMIAVVQHVELRWDFAVVEFP